MALQASLMTSYGEERELYVRLNNLESSNHGVPSEARFRGYLSQDAFTTGNAFVWERLVGLLTDVSGNQWEQGYQALQSIQLQEVPPQPAAPVPPAADASQEDLDAHAAAEAAYAEQMNLWTAKSERIASENAEAAALAGGVMV